MNSTNPKAAFNRLLLQNPQMQEAQTIINRYGNGDPKTAFFNLAKEKGIDPSTIMSQLGIN